MYIVCGLKLLGDSEGLRSLGWLTISCWRQEGECFRDGWVALWWVRDVAEGSHLVHPMEVVLECYCEVILCMNKLCFDVLKG